ncbi:MAG: hypothetical protein JWQ89_2055 [Devosia sp.]|nr:hypothetical protein [Devosia sp.]
MSFVVEDGTGKAPHRLARGAGHLLCLTPLLAASG